jgi:hypothetical protein
MVGPTPIGSAGSCELSISLIKTPGETNLNLFTDIFRFSLKTGNKIELFL